MTTGQKFFSWLEKQKSPQLIPKKIYVHGPHGTYMSTRWVRPGGDEEKTPPRDDIFWYFVGLLEENPDFAQLSPAIRNDMVGAFRQVFQEKPNTNDLLRLLRIHSGDVFRSTSSINDALLHFPSPSVQETLLLMM